MDVAVIRKVKRGKGLGRWPGYEIAQDGYGRWLFSPRGTIYWAHKIGRGPVEWDVGRPPEASEGAPELWLLEPDSWWVAMWDISYGARRISVDVCTPPRLVASEWVFEDLELDPYWGSDGALGVADEDEFLGACEAGLITKEEASNARATSAAIVASLRERTEPFGGVGWDHFERGLGLRLPPIRDLEPVSTA